MNRSFVMATGLFLFFLACGEKNRSSDADPKTATVEDTTQAASQYFPVSAFLKGEIAYVDSLPVGIMKYTSRESRQDSGYIKIEEFHKLAQEFLPSEMNDSQFVKEFQETSFMDKSTNIATFMYGSKNEKIPVRRVDIVTAKGPIYDEVKSIYIEKNYQQGDSFFIKKLFWRPKRNFQIVTLKSKGSEKPQNELIKVVWDNRE